WASRGGMGAGRGWGRNQSRGTAPWPRQPWRCWRSRFTTATLRYSNVEGHAEAAAATSTFPLIFFLALLTPFSPGRILLITDKRIRLSPIRRPTMKVINEALLESDLGQRFQYLAEFMGFGPEDVEAIHGAAPHLAPVVPALVDAVYEKLHSY